MKAQVLAGGRGKGTFTGGLQGGVHIAKRYICTHSALCLCCDTACQLNHTGIHLFSF